MTLENVHRKFADALEGRRVREDREGDGPDDRGERARRGDYRDEDWGFEKRDRGKEGRAVVYWLLGVGAVFLLGFCVSVSVVAYAFFRNVGPREPIAGPGGPGPQEQPGAVHPAPLPIEPGWDEKAMQATYLSDLREHDAHVGWGKFGKDGMLGFDHKAMPVERNKVLFGGREWPKALSTHAATRSTARVKYRLDGQYKLLRGTAAMADLPADAWEAQAHSPLVFSVLGDGRLLWTSRLLQKKGDGEGFRLGVAGVREVELRVNCAGEARYTWSVWLDPVLLR